MTIDDRRANTASAELVGEHQARWAGSNDENIGHHLNLLSTYSAQASGAFGSGEQLPSSNLTTTWLELRFTRASTYWPSQNT
jgi:hypothetical protein